MTSFIDLLTLQTEFVDVKSSEKGKSDLKKEKKKHSIARQFNNRLLGERDYVVLREVFVEAFVEQQENAFLFSCHQLNPLDLNSSEFPSFYTANPAYNGLDNSHI